MAPSRVVRATLLSAHCVLQKSGFSLTVRGLAWAAQMHTPFMYVTGIHFDALTDIAWSNQGLNLIATSKDGYCSLIDFAPGELGEPLDPDMLPTVVAKVSLDVCRSCLL